MPDTLPERSRAIQNTLRSLLSIQSQRENTLIQKVKNMNGFKYNDDSNKIVTITMDMEGPTNTMNDIFLDGLSQTMDRLEKEKDCIEGVIITSAKKEFLAGADLTKVIALEEEDKETFFKFLQDFKAISRRLEKLGKPVVAAINGTALGGGCELALACHHRIALNHSKIEIGMPESMLGLLPGGGGIVRSIRLLGFAAALPLLLEGKRLKPEKARTAGLIHDTAETEEELHSKAVDWIKANPEAIQPWDKKGYKIPGGDMTNTQVLQMVQAAPGMLKKKTKGLMPALEVILDVAVHSLRVDLETALRVESRGLVKLIQTPEAKNMINTFFFNLKDVRSFRPEGVEKSKVKRLGVIGAGMMGQGISYVSAKKGIDVIMVDVDLEAAEKGKAYSEKLLDKALGKGRITEEKKNEILSRIKPTSNSQDLEQCDLIIETVFEDLVLKHGIVKDNEPFLKEHGVFASNTSTLPITDLAKPSTKPENFIGLHFFSPVDKMPCLEIITTEKTSAETLAKSIDYANQIGKIPIVVNDGRGFFTSRVFMTFVDEGIRLLSEGIDPVLIENLVEQTGMPVGPLAVIDEVGLKTGLKITQTNIDLDALHGEKTVDLDSPGYQIGKRLVEEFKRGGRGYGGGYYEYPDDGKKFIWPQLYDLYYKKEAELPFQDIKDRVLFRMVIESLRCLEDGVLKTVRDANIGSIMGFGFPPHTGGVFQFINMLGSKNFLARTRQLQNRYGDRFNPPGILEEKAAKNDKFLDKTRMLT